MFVAISLHYFIYVLAGYPASLGFPPSHPTSLPHSLPPYLSPSRLRRAIATARTNPHSSERIIARADPWNSSLKRCVSKC